MQNGCGGTEFEIVRRCNAGCPPGGGGRPLTFQHMIAEGDAEFELMIRWLVVEALITRRALDGKGGRRYHTRAACASVSASTDAAAETLRSDSERHYLFDFGLLSNESERYDCNAISLQVPYMYLGSLPLYLLVGTST